MYKSKSVTYQYFWRREIFQKKYQWNKQNKVQEIDFVKYKILEYK